MDNKINKEESLIIREKLESGIQQIKTIEQGFNYLSKVKAIEVWAKAEKKDSKLQNMIAEQKIRTQRILGRLIEEGQQKGELYSENGEFKGNQYEVGYTGKPTKKTLKQIGITKIESMRFKQISNLPEDIFENEIAVAKEESKKSVELTTSRLLNAAKNYQKSNKRKQKAEEGAKIKTLDVDFRLGDFEEVFKDIEDGSVDCIITDPPYPVEYIECWTKLSRFAKRVLKPNGFCIAYSGQMNLPEVIKRMSEYLDYYWTFAVYHEGSTQIVNGVNIMCRWKPVLIYQNGRKKNTNVIQDYFISEAREKDGHDWQQSESGISYLIERFTNPGELIIEPFAGSGTTIRAAKKLNRNVKAAEIDITTYNIAKSSI